MGRGRGVVLNPPNLPLVQPPGELVEPLVLARHLRVAHRPVFLRRLFHGGQSPRRPPPETPPPEPKEEFRKLTAPSLAPTITSSAAQTISGATTTRYGSIDINFSPDACHSPEDRSPSPVKPPLGSPRKAEAVDPRPSTGIRPQHTRRKPSGRIGPRRQPPNAAGHGHPVKVRGGRRDGRTDSFGFPSPKGRRRDGKATGPPGGIWNG